MPTEILPLLAPLPLLLASLAANRGASPRPVRAARIAEAAAFASFLISLAALAALVSCGAGTSALLGWRGFGLSARLDGVSVAMLTLVTFIGWVVLRYAGVYLDGEKGQARFTALLCLTLASVLALAGSGNVVQLFLSWTVTSAALHHLLMFYPERTGARRAARKKFLTARISDATLFLGLALIAHAYRTTDIGAILSAARSGQESPEIQAGAVSLALSAMLKSAQFPTHGWLLEVMETPTPVSALLHAGVINAGGFLLVRFADVMLLSPGAQALLVLVGGFSALLASLAMLAQPSVKTSLAWSTVAQMGFMVLECGLALFPVALLHIIAHSLYKAHAFLASGGAVERIAAISRPGPVAIPGPGAVGRAFLAAAAIYLAIGAGLGLQHESPQAIALGAVLIFGVAYLLAQGLADAAPGALTRRTAIYATATAAGYFALQAAAAAATAGLLPPPPPPGALQWAMIALTVASFGFVAVIQAMFPLWAHHPAAAGLRVHLSNGLYANAVFDRLIGAWSTRRS